MRSLLPIAVLALAACGPPDGTVREAVSGIAVAQGPAAVHQADRQAPLRDVVDGCAGSLLPLEDAPPHYLALPPVDGPSDEPVRHAQVVRIAEGLCTVVASFTADQRPLFTTGFGDRLVDRPDHGTPAGLLLELVEAEGELWLFTNAHRGFWRIDPASGALSRDRGLDRFFAGATSDGDGGAWVVAAGEQTDGGQAIRPATLWHLDPAGVPDAEPVPLPFAPEMVGFGGGDEQGRVPHFVFHPVAVQRGALWILDSTTASLVQVAGDEVGEPIPLDLPYPSGLAPWHGELLVTSGVRMREQGGGYETLDAPAAWVVSPVSGRVDPVDALPEPSYPQGWPTASGFVSDRVVDEGVVPLDTWFPMTAADRDTAIVADPAFGRVFVIE